MNNQNRNQDLTKVFDAKWKANHNDDVKRAKAKERAFINKLFNVKEDEEDDDFDFVNADDYRVKSSREIQLERLERNMQALNNNRLNNRF